MCIDLAFHQEPLDVMSTDDSDPPPSSSLSVDTSPNTSYTLLTTMKSNESRTQVINDEQVTESSVDVDVVRKGTSQVSLSSLLETSDDSKLTRFEVTSVDALSLEGELGEKREHANSEFEIMSVVTDLDSSVNPRHPTSTDGSLRIPSKTESGSEEETVSLSEANPVNAMTTTVDENTIQETQTTDSVGNGSGIVQPWPSRFKRVNKYVRDRWTVRDMAPPEEKDPQNPQKQFQESSTNSFFSPSASRKEFSSDTMCSGSVSELGALSSGSGMLTDVSSEKDGAGSVIDRSSTAAESTLSRKSSLSSIIPDENFDTESVASASGSTVGKDRDTPEIVHGLQQQTSQGHTTQHQLYTIPTYPITTSTYSIQMPSTSVSSSGVGPVTTALAREESTASAHGPTCSCESCSESRDREAVAVKPVQESQLLKGPDSVKHAMSHLQSELEQLLKTNTFVDRQNVDLIEENKHLLDRNQKLKEENERLKSQLDELIREDKGGNQRLKEDNQKLKSELEKHRKALAIFVDDSNSSINTSPSQGTS